MGIGRISLDTSSEPVGQQTIGSVDAELVEHELHPPDAGCPLAGEPGLDRPRSGADVTRHQEGGQGLGRRAAVAVHEMVQDREAAEQVTEGLGIVHPVLPRSVEYHTAAWASTNCGLDVGYVAGMGKTSPPASTTGHTEALRIQLAEARRKQGLTHDQVAERLVDELTKRREVLQLRQLEVAKAIALDAGDDAPVKGTRVSNWETMERQPKIDEFAAWARAVGMRLVVELVPADSPQRAVMLHPDVAEVAKELDRMERGKLPDVAAIMDRILAMSRTEVRRLANYLGRDEDEP